MDYYPSVSASMGSSPSIFVSRERNQLEDRVMRLAIGLIITVVCFALTPQPVAILLSLAFSITILTRSPRNRFFLNPSDQIPRTPHMTYMQEGPAAANQFRYDYVSPAPSYQAQSSGGEHPVGTPVQTGRRLASHGTMHAQPKRVQVGSGNELPGTPDW